MELGERCPPDSSGAIGYGDRIQTEGSFAARNGRLLRVQTSMARLRLVALVATLLAACIPCEGDTADADAAPGPDG